MPRSVVRYAGVAKQLNLLIKNYKAHESKVLQELFTTKTFNV
jgi:hypothetical protein